MGQIVTGAVSNLDAHLPPSTLTRARHCEGDMPKGSEASQQRMNHCEIGGDVPLRAHGWWNGWSTAPQCQTQITSQIKDAPNFVFGQWEDILMQLSQNAALQVRRREIVDCVMVVLWTGSGVAGTEDQSGA